MRKYVILIIHITTTIILGSLSLFYSLFDSTGKKQHWCARKWGKACLDIAGVKVSVSGLSNIIGEGPFIFSSNHQSYLDIWILLSILPVPFRFLAKASLFQWPFIGWHLTKSGHIPIERSDTKAGAKSLLKAVKKIQEGTNVLIFPEGSRSDPNVLGEFKKGAFYMAAKTGVPIIPIIIKNSASLFPKEALFVYPGSVDVTILKPIETKDYGSKKVDELMEHTRKIMSDNFFGN